MFGRADTYEFSNRARRPRPDGRLRDDVVHFRRGRRNPRHGMVNFLKFGTTDPTGKLRLIAFSASIGQSGAAVERDAGERRE